MNRGRLYCYKVNARKKVATRVQVGESTLAKWISEFEMYEELKKDCRGKHSKTASPITEIEFRNQFCEFVRLNSKVQGIGIYIKVNQYLDISKSIVICFMK